MTDETEAEFDADLSIDAGLTDGLSYSATDDATVYVKHPERSPLTGRETHATLKVVTDDVALNLRLDAEALDALADALYHVQEHHQTERKNV